MRPSFARHAIAGLAVALLLGILPASTARAQACAGLPAERSAPDGQGGCLALVPVEGPARDAATPPRALVVMIHGDGTGSLEQRHVDAWMQVGRVLAAEDRVVALMIRPGYRSPAGDSSGWANPRDDDYTAANMERVAGALAALRQAHRPRHVVLVGHSGGAATAALVLGRHPGAADAALLLGCPCDVPPWRRHRNAQRGQGDRPWLNSLNPMDFVASIATATPVIAATGMRDDNTLPAFARRWVEQASAAGIDAHYEDVPGLGHAGILRWDGIANRVEALLAALAR
jgi:pimeloyl-ACP methyl ester carboxylesterase